MLLAHFFIFNFTYKINTYILYNYDNPTGLPHCLVMYNFKGAVSRDFQTRFFIKHFLIFSNAYVCVTGESPNSNSNISWKVREKKIRSSLMKNRVENLM